MPRLNTSSDNDNGSGGLDESQVVPNQNEPHFEPIIPLSPLIKLETGEEEEIKVFGGRATMFQCHSDLKE